MALFGLSKDNFEILRVLAIRRHQKIQNRANIDRATAQNVKVVKISFGRLLKLRKKFGWSYSLDTAFYGLFKDIFEILRVLAFCIHQEIYHWFISAEARA